MLQRRALIKACSWVLPRASLGGYPTHLARDVGLADEMRQPLVRLTQTAIYFDHQADVDAAQSMHRSLVGSLSRSERLRGLRMTIGWNRGGAGGFGERNDPAPVGMTGDFFPIDFAGARDQNLLAELAGRNFLLAARFCSPEFLLTAKFCSCNPKEALK